MASYYTNNFAIMFYKDVGVVNNFTLDYLDSLVPWEREIYLSMMNEKIKELAKNNT